MPNTFAQADSVAEELAPLLEEFPWFHGIAVEENQGVYSVSVRVSPRVALEDARAKSSIPAEKQGIRIHFRHQQMAKAFGAAG